MHNSSVTRGSLLIDAHVLAPPEEAEDFSASCIMNHTVGESETNVSMPKPRLHLFGVNFLESSNT